MRIVMLTYEITDKGGNFIRAFSLAKEVVLQGHHVTIYSASHHKGVWPQKSQREGVNLVEFPDVFPNKLRHDGLSPWEIILRTIWLLKEKCDLIHGFGHRPSVSIPALLKQKLQKKLYVADWCDLWGEGGVGNIRIGLLGKLIATFDTLTEKPVFSQVDALSTISSYLYQRSIEIGHSPKNLVLIPVGAPPLSKLKLSAIQLRKKHHIPPNKKLVVYAGNTSYDEKFLAQSFVNLNLLLPQTLLLFLGNSTSLFWNEIEKHKLEHLVINKGFVPHDVLIEYLACGDVALLPYSNREINRARYPNKLGDYLAAGRPVVTQPTGDLKKLFLTENIGLLASSSPSSFAQQIKTLLTNNKMRKAMGANARKLAKNKLSWNKLSHDLINFYSNQLILHKSRPKLNPSLN